MFYTTTPVEQNGNNTKKGLSLIPSIVIIIVCIIYFANRFNFLDIGNDAERSKVIEAAVLEVKSDVFNIYGEIPRINGKIIYSNDDSDYIVIVQYTVADIGSKGSQACYVKGFGSSDAFVDRITKAMPYDYSYNVEELKAMWAIK